MPLLLLQLIVSEHAVQLFLARLIKKKDVYTGSSGEDGRAVCVTQPLQTAALICVYSNNVNTGFLTVERAVAFMQRGVSALYGRVVSASPLLLFMKLYLINK